MANDTVALLDILGIDRCHLSGSSLGGAICAHIAIEHPQRVRSLQMHSSWLATRGYTAYSLGLLHSFLVTGGVDFYYEAGLPLLFSPQFMSREHERLMGVLAHMKAHPATYEGLLGQLQANLTHDLSERAVRDHRAHPGDGRRARLPPAGRGLRRAATGDPQRRARRLSRAGRTS